MSTARTNRRKWTALVVVLLGLVLNSCVSSDQQQVRDAANNFWQAVLNEDMETARQYVTWDSIEYLKLLNSGKLAVQRFETGELQITDGVAEVATVLYSGDKADMAVPVRTVLTHHQQGWQVDVQKTLGSMVNGAMGTIVDQLNSFMQNSLKGLDESLSESIDQLGENLENGLQDLKKELSRPPSTKPDGQQAI
ncbi:MAG: hypothetical protein CSA79_01220 [Thiothrix nivea]|nr:MAG: hypothetical protein CSA79_01220 [Thiothrix nivea]